MTILLTTTVMAPRTTVIKTTISMKVNETIKKKDKNSNDKYFSSVLFTL